MDRAKAKLVREILKDVFDANEDLFSDEKLRVKVLNGVIYSGSVVMKIEVAEVGQNGIVETKEAAAYRLVRERFGLPALGFRFSLNGDEYEVRGYNRKGRKFPIVGVRTSDGKPFKLGMRTVLDAVERLKTNGKKAAGKK